MSQSNRGSQSATVSVVAKLVQDRLGLEHAPESDDDIFALGATSVVAADLAGDLARKFSTVIPLRSLYETSSVCGIAGIIDSFAESADPRIPAFGAGREGSSRVLALNQESRLVLDRTGGQPAHLVIPLVYKTSDVFSSAILERALLDVLKKHEILHTIFDYEHLSGSVDGVPDAVLEKKAVSTYEQCVDLLRTFSAREFDLRNEIPFRAMLIEVGSEEWFFAIAVERIVFDRASIRILTDDIAAFYDFRLADGASRPAPLPYQFADYAQAQRNLVTGVYLDELLQYWAARLTDSGPYPRITLPCLPHRLDTDLGPEKIASANIKESDFRALKEWLYNSESTPFDATLAALRIAVAELTGRDLPGVIAPYAARDWWQAEQLIGCFANQIPIILDGSLAHQDDAISEAKSGTVEAIAHADLPFGEMLRQLYHFESQSAAIEPYIFLDGRDYSAEDSDEGWLMGDCRWAPVHLSFAPNRVYPGISVIGGLGADDFSLNIKYSSGVQQDEAIQALADNVIHQLISFSSAAK